MYYFAIQYIVMGSTMCKTCYSNGNDYDNPLLVFKHVGKHNGQVICYTCLTGIIIKKHNRHTLHV